MNSVINDTQRTPCNDLPDDTATGDQRAERAAPILVRFQTDQGHYAYDGNTGAILKLDGITYELLACFGARFGDEFRRSLATRFDQDEITHALSRLKALSKKSGIFRSISVKSRLAPFTFVAQNWRKMSGTFDHLVLRVTDVCNLRCRYCIYSGGYENERVHGKSTMPWPVARKAIDLFLENPARQVPRQSISFYGGEPLTNIALIIQCAQYVRLRDPSVNFLVTTNGTLLCDSISEFLVAQDFKVAVSLDGPPEVHDQNRVSIAGNGSYESIVRNLRALKESEPEFYEKNVTFQSTTHQNTDFRILLEFFANSSDLFTPHNMLVTNIVSGHKSYHAPILPLSNDGSWTLETLEVLFLQKVIRGERVDREFAFLRALFEKAYLRIHRRPINLKGWGENFHTMASCFPGNFKLFVQPDGKLFVCEKGNKALEIGDVSTGLDGKKICDIYRAFHDLHNGECRRCWALRFCQTCYASATRQKGAFQQRLDPQECDSIRHFWVEKLKKYVAAQEQNPGAFDYLNDTVAVGQQIPLLDFEPSYSSNRHEIDEAADPSSAHRAMQDGI